MSIGVFYIGQRRFQKTSTPHHKVFLDSLAEKYDIKIYDFIKDKPDFNCPFDSSGGIQIWDFLQANGKITEEIVIKLRTDLWFTTSSIEVLLSYIQKVVNNELDIVFLGLDFIKTPHKIYHESPAKGTKKIVDFVVVSKKSALADNDEIFSRLVKANQRSGNLLFGLLPHTEAKAVSVSCQIYLLRKEYSQPDNFQIYKEWTDLYSNIPRSSHEWVANNKEIIGTF